MLWFLLSQCFSPSYNLNTLSKKLSGNQLGFTYHGLVAHLYEEAIILDASWQQYRDQLLQFGATWLVKLDISFFFEREKNALIDSKQINNLDSTSYSPLSKFRNCFRNFSPFIICQCTSPYIVPAKVLLKECLVAPLFYSPI